MNAKTVLYIEDSRESRELVRVVLERRGFHVLTAISGLSGIQTAREHHPDIVLVDLHLPDMDGYEVATRLRADQAFSRTPIIAITASGDRDLSLTAGCDGYIEKPIDQFRFPETVQGYLDGKHDSVDTAVEHETLKRYNRALVEKLEKKIADLVEVNERLQDLDLLKSRFIQNVTHELATPLTPLVGYLKIVRNPQMGSLTAKQEKCLDGIDNAANRLRGLIDNLLTVTRLELGRGQLRIETLDCREIVEGAIKVVEEDIAAKRIALERVVPDGSKIRADRILIAQVLQQLLRNAVKFTPANGCVAIEVESHPGATRILVTDSGIGIPQQGLEKVFDLFYQVDGSTTRRFEGAGIGLTISRRIVEAHGGRIWAESPPATGGLSTEYPGSRFCIELPAEPQTRVTGALVDGVHHH